MPVKSLYYRTQSNQKHILLLLESPLVAVASSLPIAGKLPPFPLFAKSPSPPALHEQCFVRLHASALVVSSLAACLSRLVVVGLGSDPPNLLPIKGPFSQEISVAHSPKGTHICRTQDPVSCVAVLFTCHCLVCVCVCLESN